MSGYSFRHAVHPAVLALCLLLAFASSALAAQGAGQGQEVPWRIRFFEAAVVQGPKVTLGEVAAPVGDMPAELWREYAMRELWPSPAEGKGAVNMTRPRLQEAVVATMRDLAPYCLFPGSMALQRGGVALNRSQVQQLVVKELTPMLNSMPGENTLGDFRLPAAIFLQHPGQTLGLEQPKRLQPGRVSLRIVVHELDGKAVQKFTGSVFVDSWVEAPSAAAPLNRDDLLEPDKVTFIRTNLAHLRGTPWDGRGGPWRMLRPVGVDQVIYQNDLANIPTVRKGSLVTIVYISRNVTLSARGEAMADAGIGESVNVRNSQSKKEVTAVVKDAATVEIRAPGQ